ncbi:phycobiliprotein lyase [Gloeobacter violaceus]|uniref:Chromophore lyase CpcS/CpeS n=1 Tax=Gloeobacter violaceus (strain ATCC 29082 / PCC 7421) TaxID=251221 RepID=Q7NL67_GLOVI|nr:glr1259 [Gloeobacter violaceus PCC 7421]
MRFSPPMTMMDFFRKSEGTWFTQRTVHHFDAVADESGESNLIVRVLEADNPLVLQVCEAQRIDPARALGGAAFTWQDNLETDDPGPNRAAVLVDLPTDASRRSGRLLRNQGYVENIPVASRYAFAPDGVLTIDTEYVNNQGQERCWFISDHFRIRVSTVRLMGGVNLMTYCSERRCVLPDSLEALRSRHAAGVAAPR